jgi:hypothetical protein
MGGVQSRTYIVKHNVLDGHHQIHQLEKLARRVVPKLASSHVLNIVRRQAHTGPWGITVEVNTIQPPAIKSSAKSVAFMSAKHAAVLWLMEPSHLWE